MERMVPGDIQRERLDPSTVLPFGPGLQDDGMVCGVEGRIDDFAADSHNLAFLVEASAALASELNPELALGPILTSLAEREGLTLARVFGPDEVNQELHEIDLKDTGRVSPSVPPVASSTLAWWAFQQKQEVYVPRVDHDPRCQESEQTNVRSAYAVPLRSAGEIVGVLEIGSDQPDGIRPATRKLLVQLAARIAPVLAHHWAEEEIHRLQQQLFQAQKMEAMGTLAGGIAHDFNNLLSVVLGFASLVRQRLGPDDPLQDSIGMIEESAQRAAELARHLLAFARPEKQQVNPICVQEVVRRLSRMVERTFDRSIRIELSQMGDSVWVEAEPSYLEQALLNLCLNARDAMPKGGSLKIEIVPLSAGARGDAHRDSARLGDCVGISVQDTGTGIPAEVLPKIFDPFFTTKNPDRGTGLGLAMVYGFAKSHEGEVKVESEPGKGSRFTMILPRIPAPPPQVARAIEFNEGDGGTVLVVDDEQLVRAFVVEALKGLGYQVLEAENGAQALELYAEHDGKIDCVLLDLIMPELSGLETFRQLRGLDSQACIVFASGYSTGEILRGEPDAQQATFVGKPYTFHNLSVAVCQAISGNKARFGAQGKNAGTGKLSRVIGEKDKELP